MAKYTGFVQIPHSTYDEWRNATLGNGYDIDGYYGCQCLTAGHFVAMQDGSYKDVKDINREIEQKMMFGCGPDWHFPLTSLNKFSSFFIEYLLFFNAFSTIK